MANESAAGGAEPGRDVKGETKAASQAIFYRAYGLSIRSELSLPELAPGTGAGKLDVSFRVRAVRRPRSELSAATIFEFEPDTQILRWRSVGSFLIRDAREVDIDPAPEADADLLRLPLLGPVLAMLLHQRQMLVLHASGVAVGARAAIFLGDKQAGKSTTAAALVAKGHRLLADDVLAINFPAAGPSILPGFPQMKLDREPAGRFLEELAFAGAKPIPGTDKHRLYLRAPFLHGEVAPGCIYVLAAGTEARVSVLPPQDAFAAILRFSYVGRFGSGALDAASAPRHMEQCAALVRAVPVCRLEMPRDLDRLGDALRLIEAELK